MAKLVGPDDSHTRRDGDGARRRRGGEACRAERTREDPRLTRAQVHGDDKGLVLPPRVAPLQAVIVPITMKDVDEGAQLYDFGVSKPKVDAKALKKIATKY